MRTSPLLFTTMSATPVMFGAIGSPPFRLIGLHGALGTPHPILSRKFFNPNADEPYLLPARILPGVEEREQQPQRLAVKGGARAESGARGMRARRSCEIREPNREHDRPERAEAVLGEPLEYACDEGADPFEDESGVERILRERLMLDNGLRFSLARHRLIGIAAAILRKCRTPRTEHANEFAAGHSLDVPDNCYAACAERGFGFRTDTGQRAYRQGGKGRLDLRGMYQGETVRLPELGGHFRDELIRADACRAGETFGFEDIFFQRPSDFFDFPE